MLRLRLCWPALWLALFLSGCDAVPPEGTVQPGETQPGGTTSVQRSDRLAFSLPAANLSPEQRLDFNVGRSFFRNPWVIAPATTTARDGLGPLYNANACQACHLRNGRGHPPEPDALNAVSMLVRLAIPAGPGSAGKLRTVGVEPEPVYGTQLQDQGIPGVPPEGRVRVTYTEQPVRFADGFQVRLRKPRLVIDRLGYGPLHPATQLSARIAPPMIGLGLLEAIPQAGLLAQAARQPALGLQGRPNYVWDDAKGQAVLGRFGWKAAQPSLDQQNAHAALSDMGLTSSLLPAQNCTPAQLACAQAVHGNGLEGEGEVSDNIRRLLLFYTRHLAVPGRPAAAQAQVLEGKQLFHQAGCQGCHVPNWVTAADAAEPSLAAQSIWPYTDLLLHDMGAGLADGRGEFQAGPRDWRTAPLWGLGLTRAVSGHYQLLHDGRARDPLEAVLWHGGEAEAARQQVLTFDARQRAALLAFLDSL